MKTVLREQIVKKDEIYIIEEFIDVEPTTVQEECASILIEANIPIIA